MGLKSVVELYRVLKNPTYNEMSRTFDCTCQYSSNIEKCLKNLNLSYAKIKSIIINDTHFDIEQLPAANDQDIINLNITVNSNSPVSFFENFESFFKRASNTIKECRLPSEFYLVEDNYYSGDEKINDKIVCLSNLYKLIECLTIISEHKNGQQLIYFYKKDQVITLPLNIKLDDSSILGYSIELQPFLELCRDEQDDLLVNEKRTIFKETLFDFLHDKIKSEPFLFLVKNFSDFKMTFLNNMKLYLAQFSFQKIRQEVANAEIDYAGKCAKTLSDIQAKLLSVPISLAGIIAMFKTNSIIETSLLLLGIIFASVILYSTVKVQKYNLNNIECASNNVFEGFKKRYESYPEELKDSIDNEKDALDKQQKKTKQWLNFFCFASLIPAILAILFVISKIWFSNIAIIFIS